MATKDEIRQWFLTGVDLNKTYMIVACDTFDYEDYPVYISSGEVVRDQVDGINGKNMQRVMEVYVLDPDTMEEQLNESRAWHLEALPIRNQNTATITGNQSTNVSAQVVYRHPRVLITGVAGFLGSDIARFLLLGGFDVHGVDSFVCGFEENIDRLNVEFERSSSKFTFEESDVRTMQVYAGETYDCIVHYAARGELYWCRDNPGKAVDVNVNGTLNMLKVARDSSCKHFIFADTSAEYDSVPNVKVVRAFGPIENTYPTSEYLSPGQFPPMGIYAITKMAAAQFVRAWEAEHEDNIATIVRPFNVYGSGVNLERDIPPVIGAFAKAMLTNEKVTIYGDGDQTRDFIHIDDMTNLLYKIIQEPTSGTFNAGSGSAYSILDIYMYVFEAVNELGFGLSRPPTCYAPAQRGEAKDTLADIKYTSETFDWKPHVTIEEGIHRTVRDIAAKLGVSVS